MDNVHKLVFGLTIALTVIAAAQEHFGWAAFLLILALVQCPRRIGDAPRSK